MVRVSTAQLSLIDRVGQPGPSHKTSDELTGVVEMPVIQTPDKEPEPLRQESARGTWHVKAASRVSEALPAYKNFLVDNGKSMHTIESYTSDIRQLADMMEDPLVKEVTTEDLREFLKRLALKHRKPKTISRRKNALKHFFKWLNTNKVIHTNPAAALEYSKVIPPLPKILTGEEEERFIAASQATPMGHILTLLLLGGGLKRSELARLTPGDIDISDPIRPKVKIEAGARYKERSVILPVDFVPSYMEYIKGNPLARLVFNHTERSFNNILKGVAARAGVKTRVSCQILRDTYAVHLLKAGIKMEDVLERLGLAHTQENDEARNKFKRLLELAGQGG